jgi:hypothetical protein
VWCGVVWCGVVWCGVVWCGVVWCGVVWCGVVWCQRMQAQGPRGACSCTRIRKRTHSHTLYCWNSSCVRPCATTSSTVEMSGLFCEHRWTASGPSRQHRGMVGWVRWQQRWQLLAAAARALGTNKCCCTQRHTPPCPSAAPHAAARPHLDKHPARRRRTVRQHPQHQLLHITQLDVGGGLDLHTSSLCQRCGGGGTASAHV